jgi:hypothetical protein
VILSASSRSLAPGARKQETSMSSQHRPLRNVSAKWDEVLLVCRKCSRKVHGGFGKDGDKRLEKALKSALKSQGRYKVVPVSCLDICPKNAVCLVQASAPSTVHLVPPGTPMEEVVGRLAPLPEKARVRRGKAPRQQAPDSAALPSG